MLSGGCPGAEGPIVGNTGSVGVGGTGVIVGSGGTGVAVGTGGTVGVRVGTVVGTDVAEGSGVSVGTGVAEAGTVAVGGTRVALGSGVAVGSRVGVRFPGVPVIGGRVAVATTDVAVPDWLAKTPMPTAYAGIAAASVNSIRRTSH